MRVAVVVVQDPLFDLSFNLIQVLPFIDPEATFFDGADGAFGIGVAFGGIIRRKGLFGLQIAAGLDESHAGGLRAVVAHQVQALFADAVRKFPVQGLIQDFQPVGGFPIQSHRVPYHWPG